MAGFRGGFGRGGLPPRDHDGGTAAATATAPRRRFLAPTTANTEQATAPAGARGYGLEDSYGSGGYGRGGYGQDQHAGGSFGSDGYGHLGAHHGAAPALSARHAARRTHSAPPPRRGGTWTRTRAHSRKAP